MTLLNEAATRGEVVLMFVGYALGTMVYRVIKEGWKRK